MQKNSATKNFLAKRISINLFFFIPILRNLPNNKYIVNQVVSFYIYDKINFAEKSYNQKYFILPKNVKKSRFFFRFCEIFQIMSKLRVQNLMIIIQVVSA